MFEGILFVIDGIAAALLLLVAFRIIRALRRFKRHQLLSSASMIEDMPSVSVCIPARNEGHAMTDCLERVLASSYPKLEIIVLDDKSGDKTSSLIKAFAHDGVRFVEGKALRDGWLGKNQALNDLLAEASGTYVLFLDVDTRLAPHTIEQLVAYAQNEEAAMISVLPRRDDGIRISKLFAPLRYFWELLFHRHGSPAAASSAWMIDRQRFMNEFGDFSAFKDVIQPEASIADHYASSGVYRFLIGTSLLGVTYEKKWRSQMDTSIRLLFPILGTKVRRAGAAVLVLLLIMAGPLSLLFSIGAGMSVHLWLGLALYLGYSLVYGLYLQRVWRRNWLVGAALWPLIALQEALLIVFSTLRYLRHSVTWKGRVITLPKR